MQPSENQEHRRKLAEEDERLRRIRQIVDIACIGLSLGVMTRKGAQDVMADTRRKVLRLAPGDDDKYDLIYAPRLRRIARQFGGLDI